MGIKLTGRDKKNSDDLEKTKKNESKILKDNEISDHYYFNKRSKKIIWIFLPIFFLLCGFFINFQIKSLLLSKQEVFLRKALPCEIFYSENNVKYFLPGLVFKEVLIPKECFDLPGALKFDKIVVDFAGIGIYPYYGLKFNLSAKYAKSTFILYTIISYKKIVFRIDDTIVNLEDFLVNFDSWPKVSGELNLKSFFKLKNNKIIDEFHLNMKIQKLQLPGMNITGLEIPPLSIGNLFFEAHQEASNRVKVNDFSVGDKTSPILANFNGIVEVAQNSMLNSNLDLKGGVKFSEAFLKSFPILPLLMKKYTLRNDFYQVKVEGTLSNPMANPL
ncbi:MAG: hypothetical protein HQK51_17395 [Oligoflexia bacterium]|nr:hypothetical protein [Oligoflexia bacterium]